MKRRFRQLLGPLAVLAGLFFIIPPLINVGGYNFGWLMVPMLLLMYPAVAFLLCLYDGWHSGFSWMLPLLTAGLFLATVFLYYNETALFYVVIYGSLGYLGELCGYVSYRNRIKQEDVPTDRRSSSSLKNREQRNQEL